VYAVREQYDIPTEPLRGRTTPKGTPMSTVTLLDEIGDLERLIAGAPAAISTSSRPGEWLRVADDDEEVDDLFGEDDLGFDDVDEDETDEDDDDLVADDDLVGDDDLAGDLDDEI
jgi:hypothetical protein